MRTSHMRPAGAITFPGFTGAKLYMHELDLANPVLPEQFAAWGDAFSAVIQAAYAMGCKAGKAFLTIDQKRVKAGQSHRRPGPHVDGNYLFSWGSGGGSGWLTGHAGRVLAPDDHQAQYCSDAGGIIMASSFAACDVWLGEYEGDPGQGGNCAHIDMSGMTKERLEPNTIYVGNHAIHASVPVDVAVDRSLIRLTLPHTFKVAA